MSAVDSLTRIYDHKPAAYYGSARVEIEELVPAKAQRVLEIGCGDGTTMRWLRGIRTVDYALGIELMPIPAEAAKSVFETVVVGSIEDVKDLATEGRFDLILALDVLEHLSNPDQVVRLLQTLLADGGSVIISVPNIANLGVSWNLLWRGHWRYQDEGTLDRTHLKFFDEYTARQMVEGAGLKVDAVAYTYNLEILKRIGILNRFEWLRWQTYKVASRMLPKHMRISQFLIRASHP